MNFVKVHGLGNDFILIDCLRETLAEADMKDTAIQMCNRNFGIGADGILLVLPSEVADIRMRIINSDGSEAEMCGNGIRCFAKYVYEEKIVSKEMMTIETLAGIMVPKVFTDAGGKVTLVEVDMGEPVLACAEIPMIGTGQAVNVPIQVEDREFLVTAVSMGNPHCVLFVDDINAIDIAIWGPRIERSSYFPRKTNVEFVQVLNRKEVIMRVWERGAAITMACGTGSCAVAVACVCNEKTDREITLHLDGGDLQVRWDAQDKHLYMTGAAVEVFRGQWQ